MLYYGLTISNIHTCRQVDGSNNSNMQSHQVICARLKHKLQINCKGLFSSFPSFFLLLLQYNADLQLLNGLLPVTSVFLPVFLVLNFAFINTVCTESCHLFSVALLLDFHEDYCQVLDLFFL